METSERFWFDPRTRTIRDENRLAVATLLLEGDADLGPAMAAATELRDAARRAGGLNMATYRIQSLAALCFDVEASTKEEALSKATALMGRLDDGVELPDADTEDELTNAFVYPDSDGNPLQVIDIEPETPEKGKV